MIPNSTYIKRKCFKIRQILSYLKLKKIKNLILVCENKQNYLHLHHIDIENNFLVKYDIVSIILRNNIKNCGDISTHMPEVLFAHFTGATGQALGIMVKKLFDGLPDFRGRQILSLCKKNNFIFIRFHRYIFSTTGKDVKIQELGPKITLKFENFYNIASFFEKSL